MAHPFFDATTYPWHRPEAGALHRALYTAIPQPARILLLYQQSGPNLPAIAYGGAADEIWKEALEALVLAGRLRDFCSLILGDPSIAAIHPTVTAVVNASASSSSPAQTTTSIGNLPSDVEAEMYGSLTRFRRELPKNLDAVFVADYLLQRVDIVGPDAHVSRIETLRNCSGAGADEVKRIVGSDTPTTFKALKVAASVEEPGKEPFDPAIRSIQSPDGRFFHVTLSFRGRVVEPDGLITIRWQCVAPASVMRPDEYWVFPFIFQKPAKQMVLEVSFEQEPADVHLFRDDHDANGAGNLTPIAIGAPRTELTDGKKRVVYRVERPTDGHTYLFTWNLNADGQSDGVGPARDSNTGLPAGSSKPAIPGEPESPVESEKPKAPRNAPAPASPAMAVLNAAIKAVPAVRYALGVAGIAAAAAIATQFFKTPGDAFIATVAVFMMMVLLVVFAALTGRAKASAGTLVVPAQVLTWSILILFVATVTLVFASVFFRYPMSYPDLVGQFKPVSYRTLTIDVVSANGTPVGGALVVAQGHSYHSRQTAAPNGSVVLSDVPSNDSRLTLVGSLQGYVDGQVVVDAAQTASATLRLAAVPPKVEPPPAKPAIPKGNVPARPTADPIAALRGTWEIVVRGAVSTVRVRRGTFQFEPQPDGEVVVVASFVVDDIESHLTGTATMVKSRVFVKFRAKNSGGGEWSGEASFDRSAANQLSGRLQVKSGEDVPITLKKIGA